MSTIWGLGSNEFHINEGLAPMAVEQNQPSWSYQLNSTANSAHFAQFLGKSAKLAVLFSW
jgi:hypothetical protein